MATRTSENPGQKKFFDQAVFHFFIKLIALVIVWECSYYLFLKPHRIPDKFLTDTITAASAKCINLFTNQESHISWWIVKNSTSDILIQNGKTVFLIDDICNALDLILIYLGMIILLPNSLKRKLVFSIVGVIALIMADTVRVSCLFWISMKYHSFFNLSHHYVFTILMYILIMAGWLLFIKNYKKHEIS